MTAEAELDPRNRLVPLAILDNYDITDVSDGSGPQPALATVCRRHPGAVTLLAVTEGSGLSANLGQMATFAFEHELEEHPDSDAAQAVSGIQMAIATAAEEAYERWQDPPDRNAHVGRALRDAASGAVNLARDAFDKYRRAELDALRRQLDDTHDALTRITDADDDEFTTLESTVEYVVRSYRQIADSEAAAADELARLRRQIDVLRALPAAWNEQRDGASAGIVLDRIATRGGHPDDRMWAREDAQRLAGVWTSADEDPWPSHAEIEGRADAAALAEREALGEP